MHSSKAYEIKINCEVTRQGKEEQQTCTHSTKYENCQDSMENHKKDNPKVTSIKNNDNSNNNNQNQT